MLVHRPRLKTQGAAVTTVAMLALGACDDPAARTDLRPEGPPDVLAVLVLNDALHGLVESATYCRPDDEKRPSLVGLPDFTTQQICPDALGEQAGPVMNAAPELWYIRIMFDELLDPSVEDLIPELDDNNQETGIFTGTLRNTQPVTLQCQDVSGNYVAVDYDGYYSPSGNNVTWPLGPSLVIKPIDPAIIPVESECRVSLKEGIKDKSGTPVLEEQRGPFTFRIAPVEVIAISPAPDEEVAPEVGGVDLTFNVKVDTSTLDDTMYTFEPAMTNTGVYQYSDTGVFIYGDMLDSKSYKFNFVAGTKIKDKCGKESTLRGDNLSTNFKTSALELVNIVPFQGPNAVPSRKIRINFNQIMDKGTFLEGEDYEWVGGEKPELPTATTPVLAYDAVDPSVIIVNGVYKLGTNYKLHIKPGAKIKDCPSFATVGDCSTSPGELAIEEQTIDITTATAISNTAASIGAGSTSPRPASVTTISGAGGQTVRKVAENENVFVRFSFNQDMAGASLDNTEFTLTKADGTPTNIPLPAAGTGTASTTTLNVGALPAGSYKFTLKKDATINDRLATPNVYKQAADRVFTFTVSVEPPPPFSCLGAP
jgi:hypothetical protein